jgi:hypothetical protein
LTTIPVDITREDVIHIIAGDLQRLTVCGEKGWSRGRMPPTSGASERL